MRAGGTLVLNLGFAQRQIEAASQVAFHDIFAETRSVDSGSDGSSSDPEVQSTSLSSHSFSRGEVTGSGTNSVSNDATEGPSDRVAIQWPSVGVPPLPIFTRTSPTVENLQNMRFAAELLLGAVAPAASAVVEEALETILAERSQSWQPLGGSRRPLQTTSRGPLTDAELPAPDTSLSPQSPAVASSQGTMASGPSKLVTSPHLAASSVLGQRQELGPESTLGPEDLHQVTLRQPPAASVQSELLTVLRELLQAAAPTTGGQEANTTALQAAERAAGAAERAAAAAAAAVERLAEVAEATAAAAAPAGSPRRSPVSSRATSLLVQEPAINATGQEMRPCLSEAPGEEVLLHEAAAQTDEIGQQSGWDGEDLPDSEVPEQMQPDPESALPVLQGGALRALSGQEVWIDESDGAITGASLWLCGRPPTASRRPLAAFDVCVPWAEALPGNAAASGRPSPRASPLHSPKGSTGHSFTGRRSPAGTRTLQLPDGEYDEDFEEDDLADSPHQEGEEEAVTPRQVLRKISGIMCEMSAMEASLANLREELDKAEPIEAEGAARGPGGPHSIRGSSPLRPRSADARAQAAQRGLIRKRLPDELLWLEDLVKGRTPGRRPPAAGRLTPAGRRVQPTFTGLSAAAPRASVRAGSCGNVGMRGGSLISAARATQVR